MYKNVIKKHSIAIIAIDFPSQQRRIIYSNTDMRGKKNIFFKLQFLAIIFLY